MKLLLGNQHTSAICITRAAARSAVARRTTEPRHRGLVRTATVLAWICLAAAAVPTVTEAQEAHIPDENLRAAIEEALDKDSGEAITEAEMESLTELEARDDGIKDLTGLEHATGLTELRLWYNEIEDTSPLSGLTSLTHLRLGNNRIRDVSPLSELTSLVVLGLSDNAITDVSPLRRTTSLVFLNLSDNRILDVTPLSGMISLDWLDLVNTGVWDLTPLSGLTSLGALFLSDNGIADLSPLSGLTSLRALYLEGNAISGLSPIRGITSELKSLYLSNNSISDVSPLSDMTSLERLDLSNNAVWDLSPISGMSLLEKLFLSDNRITDLTPLERLTSVYELDLTGNRISDLAPLARLTGVEFLRLSDNRISDLTPLSGLSTLIRLHLSDNEISDVSPLRRLLPIILDLSRNAISDVSPLSRMLVARLFLSDNEISEVPLSHMIWLRHLDLSNNRIESLSTLGELSDLESLDVAVNEIADVGPVTRLPSLQSLDLGGNAVADISPLASEADSLGSVSLWRNPLDGTSLDIHRPAMRERGVTEAGGGWRVPFFPAPDGIRQGFVRVVSSTVGEPLWDTDASDRAWVYGWDQDATKPARLLLGARNARHFNADDLPSGNPDKGLRSMIGFEAGDSLDVYASAEIDVLSYIRTTDGFVTAMHDTVPWLPPENVRLDVLRGRTVAESEGRAAGGHFVPIFNPASNPNQRSMLRLVNAGDEEVDVAVYAVDDRGTAAGPVRLSLAARSTRTLSATELESGEASDLNGSLGDGAGKWRLVVSADREIHVMNLMSSPTDHLTNLSTSSDGGLTVPMFPAASHPTQQGFVRVTNLSSTAGTVEIRGYDDEGTAHGPLTLQLPASRTVHFNSDDWENGNADKGLEGAAGDGEGAWRLEFESTLDLAVSAYVRTSDGFLTSMHDLVERDTCAVEEVEGGRIAARSERLVAFRPCRDERRVPFFNPASNTRQVSSLRLVNRGDVDAATTIFGVDDDGAERGPALLSLPAGTARTLTSQELESGDGDGLNGALGDGTGKWELRVFVAGEAAGDVMVMSVLESPTGHLTNLSTWPDGELRLE